VLIQYCPDVFSIYQVIIMRKQLLTSVSLLAVLVSSQALGDVIMARLEHWKLRVGADLIQEAGMRFQRPTKFRKTTGGATTRLGPSANNDGLAFTTAAHAYIAAEKETKNNTTYGVRVGLFATTRGSMPTQDQWGRTYVFAENDNWGKIELGSKKGASTAMELSASDIAAGSGAFNGTWNNYISLDSFSRGSNYTQQEMFKGNFADDTRLIIKDNERNANNEGSRKITYYIPNYKGFQAGISYVPDEANRGGNPINQNPFVDTGPTRNIRNAIMAGASYKKQLDKKQNFKVALVAETGQLIRSYTDAQAGRAFIRRAFGFELGGVYEYDKFSVAASYGDRGKFKYHRQPNLRKTVFYTAALAYKCTDKIKTSIAYFRSDNRNTLDLITLGAQYDWIPGVRAYAEVTQVMAHQRYNYATPSQDVTADKTVAAAGRPGRTNVRNSGTVGVVGLRVEL
jgi:hypothetical protein